MQNQNAADGTRRFYVRCPEAMRVEVSAELLRQWTIDHAAVAPWIAEALALRGVLTETVPGRLWRLGKTDWLGVPRELMLARGLGWDDGTKLARRIAVATRPIILVAETAPPSDVWRTRAPAVVPLSHVVALGPTGPSMDRTQLHAIVQGADASHESPVDETLLDQVRRLMRQAQGKLATDDVLVAAYKIHGSYRKAAEAMLAEDYETDRWAVERAVKRAGGVKAAVSRTCSDSVTRVAGRHASAAPPKAIAHRSPHGG